MAKKIIKGIGKALGISKKKAAPVEEGPKITPLNPEEAKKRLPKRGLEAARIGTILSDKLGGPRQGLGG